MNEEGLESKNIGYSAIIELLPGRIISEQIAFAKELAEDISDNGSLLVFSHDDYVDGELDPWPLKLERGIRDITDLKLKNIFIVYREIDTPVGKPLSSAYTSVLFFVKSTKYIFTKDEVREPHIFKDLEWGKRSQGISGYHQGRESERYPSRGRDPGNVFYKDRRDETGVVIDIMEYPEPELFEKLVKLTTEKEWHVITNMGNGNLDRAVTSLGRKLVRRDVS